jgi:hypothetical protein
MVAPVEITRTDHTAAELRSLTLKIIRAGGGVLTEGMETHMI